MSPPFMQLYVGDYLGDTQHFSTEQHGAYILILFALWRADGELPDDDTKLARIVRLSVARWRSIKVDVMEKFDVEGGRITQGRLTKELQRAREKSLKRSEAGRAGGNANALKLIGAPVANATPLLEHLSEPEPEPESKKKTSKTRTPPARGDAAARKCGIPDDFPHQAALDAAARYWREKLRPDLAEKITDQAAQFRDHHISRGQKMLDWGAAWRTWVRNALEFNRAPRDLLASAPPKAVAEVDLWLYRLETFHHGDQDEQPGYWQEKWGPPPSGPGCLAPEEAKRAYAQRHRPRLAK